MPSKKMCMQCTCRVQTTVTGGKLAASEGKLHAILRSNGFWHQKNRARKKDNNTGMLKAFGKHGLSTGDISYYSGCPVRANNIDCRELCVIAVQSFKLTEGSCQVSYQSHRQGQLKMQSSSR